MRPTANFTLHAILAACLAALAASSAAAAKPVIDNEGHVYLTGAIFGSGGASQRQQIEVHGFTWGPRQSALKLDRNYVKSWSTSGDAAPPPPGGGRNQVRMEDSAGAAEAAKERQAGMTDLQADKLDQPSGRVTGLAVDPADPASGLPTGKRQHKPMVARGYYDQAAPPPSGSLIVLASSASCRVGARYPTLSLKGRGKTYVLQDLQVADCGSGAGPEEQITFVYGKVIVRGWDPAPKKE